MSKCSVVDDIEVVPCENLRSVTEYGNPSKRSKGVVSWKLINSNTGKLSRLFFGAKSGERLEKGLAFNFCPFCGEDISKPLGNDS